MYIDYFNADGGFRNQHRQCAQGKVAYETSETGRWRVSGDTLTIDIATVNGKPDPRSDRYRDQVGRRQNAELFLSAHQFRVPRAQGERVLQDAALRPVELMMRKALLLCGLLSAAPVVFWVAPARAQQSWMVGRWYGYGQPGDKSQMWIGTASAGRKIPCPASPMHPGKSHRPYQ